MAKITEMGFQADEAAAALRQNNGNFQQALDTLLRQGPRGGARDGPGSARQAKFESDRGDRGRGRRERKDEDSVGKDTLSFLFLTDLAFCVCSQNGHFYQQFIHSFQIVIIASIILLNIKSDVKMCQVDLLKHVCEKLPVKSWEVILVTRQIAKVRW